VLVGSGRGGGGQGPLDETVKSTHCGNERSNPFWPRFLVVISG
jgi:hypothetical protein